MNAPDTWLISYSLVFAIAVAAAFTFSAAVGFREGIRRDAWMALLTATLLGGIIGSRLIDFDLGPMSPGQKTILGGLVGGVAAVVLASRALGLNGPRALDRLVPGTLLAMAIGRLGCLVAGCCFGTPTDTAWGVLYGPGTAAWDAQFAAGLIQQHAATALPVHPVPLYEAMADLLLLGLVLRNGRRLRPGQSLLFMMGGYAFVRLLMEFWRGGRESVAGLNPVQWVLLFTIIGLVSTYFVVGRRERSQEIAVQARVTRTPVLLATCMVTVVVLSGWFGSVERMVLVAAALGSCAYMRRARFPIPGLRLAVVSPGLALLLFQAGDASDRYPRRHVAVGGGFLRGAYDVFLGSTGGEDCYGGGEPLRKYDAERAYTAAAVSVSYRLEEAQYDAWTVQASFFFGQDNFQALLEDGAPTPPGSGASTVGVPGDFRLRGGTISGGVDGHYVGLRGGIMFGDLTNGVESGGLRLLGSIRVGALSSGFVELHGNDLKPLSPPANELFLSGGFGTGNFGNRIRVGLGSEGSRIGTFRLVAPSGGWELEGILGLRDAERSSAFYTIVGIGLQKRFGSD